MVLTLTYKQQPTRHLISVDDQGFYTVNRKPYGNARSLHDIIKELAKPNVQGWQQPLTGFVPRSDCSPSQIHADRNALGLV